MGSKHTGEEAFAVAVESCLDHARVDAVGRHVGAHFLIKPDHTPPKGKANSATLLLYFPFNAQTCSRKKRFYCTKTCIAWLLNEKKQTRKLNNISTDLEPRGERSRVQHIGELRNRVRLRRVVRSGCVCFSEEKQASAG
jgi:hypothetical protein